jgi:hypothetical protein
MLQAGFFGEPKKLIITPERISFDGVMIDQNTFTDVKYVSEHIVWYKFYVGVEFRIDIKYEGSKILSLKFTKHAWKNRRYGQMYSDISNYIGNYFLIQRINERLDQLDRTGDVELLGVKITSGDISLAKSNTIPLANVGLKEYASYFVIYDKADPNNHKRISFNEWNTELLFNVVKNLINS